MDHGEAPAGTGRHTSRDRNRRALQRRDFPGTPCHLQGPVRTQPSAPPAPRATPRIYDREDGRLVRHLPFAWPFPQVLEVSHDFALYGRRPLVTLPVQPTAQFGIHFAQDLHAPRVYRGTHTDQTAAAHKVPDHVVVRENTSPSDHGDLDGGGYLQQFCQREQLPGPSHEAAHGGGNPQKGPRLVVDPQAVEGVVGRDGSRTRPLHSQSHRSHVDALGRHLEDDGNVDCPGALKRHSVRRVRIQGQGCAHRAVRGNSTESGVRPSRVQFDGLDTRRRHIAQEGDPGLGVIAYAAAGTDEEHAVLAANL